MGQINSTRSSSRSALDLRQVDGLHAADTGIPDRPDTHVPAVLTDPEINAGKRAHRKSLRNNIVGLVRSRSSRNTAGVVQDGTENRKWWRSSRRWSMAPPVRQTESQGVPSSESTASYGSSQRQTLVGSRASAHNVEHSNDNNASLPPPSTHDIHDGQGSTTGLLNSDFVETPNSDPITSSKGQERSVETSSDVAENPGEDVPPRLRSEDAFREVVSTSPLDSSSSSSGAPGASTHLPSGVINQNGQSSEASSPAPGHSISQAASNISTLRQFPPAGTLVVVQGVVHTGGASRPVHDGSASSMYPAQLSSTSTSSTQQRQPRAPLGAELNGMHNDMRRRRDSGTSLASHASIEPSTVEAPGSHGPPDLSNRASEDVSVNSPRSELSEGLPHSAATASAGFGNSQRQSPLSSNSVDVLGALLSIVSVATAATAASLLSSPNGRPSPPLLSTDHPNVPASMAPSNPPAGSTIPVLARALASANPAAAAVLAQREREREERERTRVRSLWEGLRERVTNGRGSRGPPGPDSLFSELSRAFNMGSSPDERSSEAQDASPVRPSSDGDQASSSQGRNSQGHDTDSVPPDSFERFLVDLQSDLRVALTRTNAVPNVTSTRHPDEDDGRDEVGIISGNAGASNLEGVFPAASVVTESSIAHSVHELARSEETHPPDLPNTDGSGTGPVRPSSMPSALEDTTHANVIDTDHPSFGSEDSNETNIGPNNGEETNAAGRNASEASTSSSNATANGINWWRMYRFPPMRPTQLRRGGLDRNVSETNTAHLHAPSASMAQVNVAESAGPSTPSDPALQENAGMVVPVIVVGLQSVNSGARRFPPPPSNPTVRADDEVSESTRETADSDLGSTHDSAVPQRGRGNWPSRAARAFSRLGRRGVATADQGHDALDSISGARTFFIYVFGGHYPPDHHILSGSDALDSFEALWELAEFLGQVKSPVATDEEIERSGLELFKARSLGEFESRGRIASNCVDRCLICLDDYDPDDDLRLLYCKHTFHKACVDRWLKTGRNNCPACRSEGVKTENAASMPSL